MPKLKFSTKVSTLLMLLVFGAINFSFAQRQNLDSVVFSINDKPIYTSEFLKQYKKNNNTTSADDDFSLRNYAELYLQFKLKVNAAKDLGLHQESEFINEYNRYRKQLADKYISNGKVTQEMVDKIYYRMVNEVNASHILLTLEKGASPADTLETYNKAIDLLKKIQGGTPFEDLAVEFSNDPSVASNKGNLGWFKAYHMVYPFETAAYELEVGEVSEPVRTQFGYHLIKKNDERLSKGKVKVAHIMKRNMPTDSTYSAKDEIFKIYNKLKNGEEFEALAKQFSDHEPTASNGGDLAPFGLKEMNSHRFEKVAFDMDEVNSISEPFETKFGWHIIKYKGNVPVEPLENIKEEVIRKIKTSDRSKKLISNIKKDLLNIYDLQINYEILSSLEDRIDESLMKYKWMYDEENKDKKEWILKIDDKQFWMNEFLNYIQKQQRSLTGIDVSDKINNAIDKFSYAKLIAIHNENLENISPEFASEIKTYYEGLLLFEIMEQKIWKPVQEDSLAQLDFYKANRDKFVNPTRIDGYLVTSSDKKEINKVKALVGIDSLNILKEKFPNSIFKSLYKEDIKSIFLPYELRLEVDSPEVYKHNEQFLCVYITKIYPPEVSEFEEVRGRVIDLLQKEREAEWVKKLKSEYDIFINAELIENISRSFEK